MLDRHRPGTLQIDCFYGSLLIQCLIFIFIGVALVYSTSKPVLMTREEIITFISVSNNFRLGTRPNGTKYFIKTGDSPLQYYHLLNSPQYLRMLGGENRYDYGSTFYNFCWPRPIPTSDWVPSMFATLQLRISVQVLFRSAVLVAVGWRMFAVFAITRRYFLLTNRFHPLWNLISWAASWNEAIHFSSLSVLFCFSTHNDKSLSHIYPYLVPISLVTLVIKHIIAIIATTKFCRLTVLRISIAAACIIFFKSICDHSLASIDTITCDQFVPPYKILPELAYGLPLLITTIIDLMESHLLQVYVVADPAPEQNLVLILQNYHHKNRK